MKKSKTIVLWGREDLMSTSVEIFLSSHTGWNVVNISSEDDLDAMIRIVDKIHPDVVIVLRENLSFNLNLLAILFQYHQGLKVIFVSSDNNLVELYGKQVVQVASASDLISMVEADLFKSTEEQL